MKIIAVDPGPEQSAFVVMDNGAIMEHAKVDNAWLLTFLKGFLGYRESHLVIEQIASFGMSVGAEVFETVFWSGRFAEAFPGDFYRIKRHEVKMHLCQNMRARDGNIRQAIIDRYGGMGTAIGRKKTPGPLYGIAGDQWSALAVALVFHDRNQELPLGSESNVKGSVNE